MLQIDEEQVSAQELMDALPDLYFSLNPNGRAVYYCPRWNDLFGLNLKNASEISAKIIHPEDIGQALIVMGKALQTKTTAQFEYRLKLAETNAYNWYSVTLSPIIREKKLIGWIGYARDVNDQRILLDELQRNERRKDEFIGMASHELKTPITSAKMILQIVQKQLKEDKKEGAGPLLDKAELQINRLTRLTNDLLDVSRIKAGKLSLMREIVDFDTFFCDTIESIPANHHKILAQANTRCKISLDKGRLAQVLNNLVQNAIKYSPNSKKVIVKATTDGFKIIVSVQDFGIGIAKDKQSNIFDRFYRVEEQVAETFSGLGLGLYIASEIVHLHGGRIWVESELNKGSTFFFTLPR